MINFNNSKAFSPILVPVLTAILFLFIFGGILFYYRWLPELKQPEFECTQNIDCGKDFCQQGRDICVKIKHLCQNHKCIIPTETFPHHFCLEGECVRKEEKPKKEEIKKEEIVWRTYRNEKYGYEIRSPVGEENVGILVSKQLSVPLMGTFGGRYVYSEQEPGEGRIFTEDVTINGIPFKKDYWAVYGGMGAWDNIINCYTKHNNNYYIISLEHMFAGGVPGMVIAGGKKLTKEEITSHALKRMRNEKNEYVKMFNKMLSSFKFLE